MARFVSQTGASSGSAGAIVGLYVGLGFVATAMFAEVLFAGRHPRQGPSSKIGLTGGAPLWR
jgi:hypothetical protein